MTTETSVAPKSLAAGEWTPARVFLLASTIWHIPLGIVGFFYIRNFPIGAEATKAAGSAQIFGVFETNGWHTLAALILGVASLYFTINSQNARAAALAIGAFHVVIVASLAIWDPSTFWLASDGADQVAHSSTAVLGLASGLLTRLNMG